MDIKFLASTYLFQGMRLDEISGIMGCLQAEEKEYKKGEYIYRVGDQVHRIGLLLSGQLSIENDDLWGNKTILNMITPGNVFLENYACIPNEPLMISVVAVSKATVLYLDMSHLITPCNNSCSFHNKLIQNLLSISARKNLNLSRRSFHTAAKTIRTRLLSYLSYEAAKQGGYEFDIPFNRQQLADYLNVDRSALSNELSKMTKEGLLVVNRSHFQIQQDTLPLLL